VFVIGSPRSGTSILTWCLGQHPNLLGLPESNWMAPFAIDVAVAHARGSLRGELSQISAMGMDRDQLMADMGACIDAAILDRRIDYEARLSEEAQPESSECHEGFKVSRDGSEPKQRFVDGTPEYSLGLGGLRKLFPDARFIHLVRDGSDVVPSLVQLQHMAEMRQVDDDEGGYRLWMRFVRACLDAEEAWGPGVVCRLLHQDLVQDPEASLRRLLEFIDEPFTEACLEPLTKRINSSRGTAEHLVGDPPPDPEVVRSAQLLWEEVRDRPAASGPCAEAAARVDGAFERRVEYVQGLDGQYARAQQAHKELEQAFVDRSAWADDLNQQVADKSELILKMQGEFEDRTAWALRMNEEIQEKDRIIHELKRRLGER